MAPGLESTCGKKIWRWFIADRVGRARGLDLHPHLGRALREDEAGDEGEHRFQAGDLVLAVEAGTEARLIARASGHLDAPVVSSDHREAEIMLGQHDPVNGVDVVGGLARGVHPLLGAVSKDESFTVPSLTSRESS